MIEKIFTVTIRSRVKEDQKLDSKEQEAEELRDIILDGCGYPLSIDTGELTIDVVCENLKDLK